MIVRDAVIETRAGLRERTARAQVEIMKNVARFKTLWMKGTRKEMIMVVRMVRIEDDQGARGQDDNE